MFKTIALLTASNIFMTFAWYGHLKFKEQVLWKVVIISWVIAFFEYCLQVPANRIGSNYFSLFQLRTLQEVISLTVFALFAVYMMNETIKWNYIVAFLCLILAVFFMFKKW
ncbi:MAG TPA: DMT family protein [Bacteroidia bacterium]|nr:DMT family protein [Bacteroidia bacterium]